MCCPYFLLDMRKIPIAGHPQPMRLPVCRCTLTEAFVQRLRTHSEGKKLAFFLEDTPQDDLLCSVLGADLQVASCTDQRRRECCLPQFVETLTDFRLDTTVPPAE